MAVKSFNRVMLIGRVGRDPEFNTTPNNKKYSKFSLSTWRSWKDASGEWQQDTQWHNIIAWGYQAEVCEKLHKGSLVYVNGEINYNSYKKDDETKYFTQIKASEIGLLDSGSSDSSKSSGDDLSLEDEEDLF